MMRTNSEPKIDKWGTFDGRWIEAKKISHQHASNIFYYVTFIQKELYPDWTRRAIRNLLQEHFDGEILPYKPYYDWEKKLVMRKCVVDEHNDIFVNTIHIGTL